MAFWVNTMSSIYSSIQISRSTSVLYIVATGDFVAAWGAKKLLSQYGIKITAITGPVANNDTATLFIEKHLHIPAESNLHEMSKTIRLIEERLQQAQLDTIGV